MPIASPPNISPKRCSIAVSIAIIGNSAGLDHLAMPGGDGLGEPHAAREFFESRMMPQSIEARFGSDPRHPHVALRETPLQRSEGDFIFAQPGVRNREPVGRNIARF